jgi:hypothetical protein
MINILDFGNKEEKNNNNCLNDLIEYFKEESKFHYINKICEKDHETLQKKFQNYVFDYCKGCKVIFVWCML